MDPNDTMIAVNSNLTFANVNTTNENNNTATTTNTVADKNPPKVNETLLYPPQRKTIERAPSQGSNLTIPSVSIVTRTSDYDRSLNLTQQQQQEKYMNQLDSSAATAKLLQTPQMREQKSSFKRKMKAYEGYLKSKNENVYQRRKTLLRFINNGPYSANEYKIDKIQIIKSAFGKNLDVIYDEKASTAKKLRRLLLSPQWNVVIIFLILLDWLIAVGLLLTDLFQNKNAIVLNFDEFAKYFSLAMLSLFLIEIILKALFVPKIFFRSKLELFDGFIVVVSFTLELLFILKNFQFHGISSVLTIFRLWRIVRLINRFVIAIEKHIFREMNLIRDEVIDLMIENERLRVDLQAVVMSNMLKPIEKSFV